MHKAKNRTVATVTMMLVVAMAILSFYFYWSYRTTPIGNSSKENMTEAQKLIQRDLGSYYPETPREVVKLFGSMMKTLYNDISDEDLEPLALKIRALYDEEFIAANPQNTYLNNITTDIAIWKDKNRRITNYLMVNEDQVQQSEIDGVQYSIQYISFTIQENTKFTETWKVMLRQSADQKWKILGWQVLPENSQ